MLATFMGEPPKGSNLRTVGSWRAARVFSHLGEKSLELEQETFCFELSFTNPSFRGQKFTRVSQKPIL